MATARSRCVYPRDLRLSYPRFTNREALTNIDCRAGGDSRGVINGPLAGRTDNLSKATDLREVFTFSLLPCFVHQTQNRIDDHLRLVVLNTVARMFGKDEGTSR